MDATAVQIIVGLLMVLVSWLHLRVSNVAKKLEDKADHRDISELKTDLKEILKTLTELKVEQARWQGRSEAATESSKLDKS